jgi:hypothetical protein
MAGKCLHHISKHFGLVSDMITRISLSLISYQNGRKPCVSPVASAAAPAPADHGLFLLHADARAHRSNAMSAALGKPMKIVQAR